MCNNKIILVFILLHLFFLTTASFSQMNFFVSTNGSDKNPGTKEKPFATLDRAREAVRDAKKKQTSRSINVYLRKGYYQIEKTFVLEAEDSGNKNQSITYRSYGNEEVHLIGGKEISGFVPVKDPSILGRLDEKCQDKVYQLDLKAKGINDYGELSGRGFGKAITPSHLELFYNNKPMTLARWPNNGWANIADTVIGKKDSCFRYDGDRPQKWSQTKDIWLHGYWTWDWADSYTKIGNIDFENRIISTLPPHGVYGYSKGKRYYALNIFEELDEPGEYYMDRETGILYFYPPESLNNAKTFISLLESPLISLHNTSYITFSNLIIEYTRGAGIEIIGGTKNLIAGCTIRNIGTVGVCIGRLEPLIGNVIYENTLYDGEAGTENGIISCDIYQCGEGGIILCGGDRKTLTPGKNFAENNHIWDCCRWVNTYRAAIFMWGAGNIVKNNLIHNLPHTAIFFWGNDHLIEYNEIHNVCLETGDAGALYIGRDWTQRGSIIRYNYIHHLHGVEGQTGFTDVMGVYLDDLASGTTVYGNIFYEAGRSIMIGGGRDNIIENNIIIDGNPALHIDSRAKGGWMVSYLKSPECPLFKRLDTIKYNQPPYSVHYPTLINLLQDDPASPKGNKIISNIFYRGKWVEFLDGLDEKLVYFDKNLINEDPEFFSLENEFFYLKRTSPAFKLGFKQIPHEKIGLHYDKYRRILP
jgi:hypothetical protein